MRTIAFFLFLVVCGLATSAFQPRCIIFCNDQTTTQLEYIKMRDGCRQYAQLKIDSGLINMATGSDAKDRNAQLVSLFSECMGKNGWTVPDGKPPGSSQTSATTTSSLADPAAAEKAALAAEAQRNKKAFLARSGECTFARQAAANSSVAAARAKACDLECTERLRAAPDAPRPAACPAEFDNRLERGVDRE